MSRITLDHVCKGFGPPSNRYEVLTNASLDVADSEFVAVIGFSGSGKSTLISLLAGLETPDSGGVFVDGVEVREPSPQLGIMFQNYSLLPWLTVFGNVELAVRQVFPEMSRSERKAHVEHYLEMVSLLPAAHKRPRELSGGMRQRLSLARTLSMKPNVLLLDEPLSALDALTRSQIQLELLRIWEREQRTVVMVTNDIDEAILLADRIVPLTIGPRATLGESFKVELDRPRLAESIAYDSRFKKLRNDLIHYLASLSGEHRRHRPAQSLTPPAFEPILVTS